MPARAELHLCPIGNCSAEVIIPPGDLGQQVSASAWIGYDAQGRGHWHDNSEYVLSLSCAAEHSLVVVWRDGSCPQPGCDHSRSKITLMPQAAVPTVDPRTNGGVTS